jgi:hypothetical protein
MISRDVFGNMTPITKKYLNHRQERRLTLTNETELSGRNFENSLTPSLLLSSKKTHSQ